MKIKAIIYTFFFIIISNYIYSDQVEFIEKLSNKKQATFYDLIYCFCSISNVEATDDFTTNLNNLKNKIKIFPKNIKQDKPITIGDYSLLAIQYLNIKSGIFYLLTNTGRYALKELILLGIIPPLTSEMNYLTGLELLTYIQKVAGYDEK